MPTYFPNIRRFTQLTGKAKRTARSNTIEQGDASPIFSPPLLPPGGARTRATPLPMEDIPGGALDRIPGMPEPEPEPTPDEPIKASLDQFMANAPTTGMGKLFEVLKTAGLGFLQSAAKDPENPIAAGLGGAATAGAIGAISPKTGRAFQFDILKRPQLEEVERKAAAREDRARAIEFDKARTEHVKSETEKNRRPVPVRARPPVRSDRGLYDVEAGRIIPGTEPLQKETPPDRRFTDKGMVDVSKLPPEELRKLNPYQRPRAPRDGSGDKSAKAQADFDRTKAALDDAVAQGDEDTAKVLRQQLRSQAVNLAKKYGKLAAFPETSGLPPGIGAITQPKAAMPTRQDRLKSGRKDSLGIR